MDKNEFGRLFAAFERTAFRLETREEYVVDEERAEFASFCAGSLFSKKKNAEWVALVSAACDAGKMMSRVHVLPEPLSPYIRFEIEWGYLYSADAGEDIRLLSAEQTAFVSKTLPDDFWLFDDTVLIWMKYRDDGRFLGVEEDKDPAAIEACQRLRDELMLHSMTLRSYLARIRTC